MFDHTSTYQGTPPGDATFQVPNPAASLHANATALGPFAGAATISLIDPTGGTAFTLDNGAGANPTQGGFTTGSAPGQQGTWRVHFGGSGTGDVRVVVVTG